MNTQTNTVAQAIADTLADIRNSGQVVRGHAGSLQRELESYHASVESFSHSGENSVASDVLTMLGTLDPSQCGKDGRDQLAYRTFSKTLQSVMSATLDTETTHAASGFTVSIKTKQVKDAVKGIKEFDIGVSFKSVERLNKETNRAADDKRVNEERAVEDADTERHEADEERAQLTPAEQDQMILDAVRIMFPACNPLDRITELLDRRTVDTVTTAETA